LVPVASNFLVVVVAARGGVVAGVAVALLALVGAQAARQLAVLLSTKLRATLGLQTEALVAPAATTTVMQLAALAAQVVVIPAVAVAVALAQFMSFGNWKRCSCIA
jgi:hypothetical protein